MPESVIDIKMDLSDAIAKSEIFNRLTAEQQKNLKNLIVTSTTLNKEGQARTAYVQAQISAEERLNVTLRKGKDGWYTYSQSVNISTEALKKHRQEQQAVFKAVEQTANVEKKIRSLQSTIGKLLQPQNTKIVDANPLLNLENNPKIITTVRRIAELGAKAKLSKKEVSELFEKFQGGTLNAADGRFSNIIKQFQTLQRSIESVNKSAGLAGGGGKLPPDEKTISLADQLNDAYQRIKISLQYFLIYKGFNILSQQLTEAVTSARQFQVEISLLRTVSQESQLSFGRWEQEIKKVSNSLGIDFVDTAKAFNETVQNQIAKGINVAPFVESAGELSRVTGSTLPEATNLLSSAINAYKFSASDADELSGKFFKAVDLGRIKVSDLADTFGRVAFVGKDLGVEFEELLAIMSAMTRSGITTDDAITFLTNGMNKLTKPTEATKKILESWGFATGTAAVQTKGFTQVLLDLIKASEDGQISIEEVFNEIRGEKFGKGFKALSGQIADDFRKIKEESRGTFTTAKVIRGESDADFINKTLNTLRNEAALGFGNMFAKVLKDLLELTGGTEKLIAVFSRLFRLTATGAVTYGTYKTAVLAMAAAQLVMARNTATATTATVSNTGATVAGATAARAHPIVLLATVAASIGTYFTLAGYEADSFNEKLLGWNDHLEKINKTQKEIKQAEFFKEAGKDIEAAQKALKGLAETLSKELALANAELEKVQDTSRTTGENLRVGFGQYVDSARKGINDISRELGSMDDRINRSARSMLDFKNNIESIRFGVVRQFANQDQLPDLLSKQSEKLRSKAKELFLLGTDEAVAEARQLFAQAAQLAVEKFNAQQDDQDFQFKKDLQSGRQLGPLSRDSRGNIIRGVDITPLDKELAMIEAEKSQAEIQLQAAKQTEKVFLTRQEISAKDRLRQAQAAIEQLNKFTIYDRSGNVLPEFKDQLTGKPDLERVRKRFSELQVRLFSTLDKETLQQFGLDKLLFERLRSVEDEIKTTSNVQALSQQQKEVIDGQQNLNQSFSEGKQKLVEYRDAIGGVNGELSTLAEKLKSLNSANLAREAGITNVIGGGTDTSDTIKRNVLRGGSAVLDGLNFLTRNTTGKEYTPPNVAQFKERQQAITKDLTETQIKLEELTKKIQTNNFTGVEVQEGARLISVLATNVQLLKQFRQSAGASTEEFGAIESDIQRLSMAFNSAIDNYNKQITTFQQLKTEAGLVQSLTSDININIDSISKVSITAGTTAGAAFDIMRNKIEPVEKSLERTLGLMQSLGVLKSSASREGRAYGGPIGHDNVPTWLSKGEYVVNADSTRQFYSQIQSMNNYGRTPQYFNEGGMVDMSGWSFNVNGAQSPQATGRELMRIVKREMRRGK